MISVARSISHGKAYSEYAGKKAKAVFVGAENMVTNTDIIFDNKDFLEDLWREFEEAGVDYVRKGKDVKRNIIAIEFSPTTNESEGWTREQWFVRAKELLKKMDDVPLRTPIWNAKKKRYERDNNGNLKYRDIPKTKLSRSKWMAYLHKDSESGIWHLHIIVSRYNLDNELNCDDDIAKRAAQATEELNKKYGYRSAEDIHAEHVAEIKHVLDDILFQMDGENIDIDDFQKRVKEATFVDYKGNVRDYDIKCHTDENGKVTGWSVRRGNSTFTGTELGLKLTINPNAHQKQYIKDAIYDTLRSMNDSFFSWNTFELIMEIEHGCQVNLKRDSNDNVVNYTVTRGNSRPYSASQIGANVTAKKIVDEWKKEKRKQRGEAPQPGISKKEKEEENRPRRWPKQGQTELQKPPQKQQSPGPRSVEPTEGSIERTAAVDKAKENIYRWKNSPFGVLYEDMKEIIDNGAAAQAIENGTSPFVDVNLKGAVQELAEGMGLSESQISRLMTSTASALVGMAIPPDMPVSAGPGSNTDLPKQKDDWWNGWKNAYGMKLASPKKGRSK